MQIKFYAACLSSYNNGVLHGVWVEAEGDADAMGEKISEMLRNSPFPNVTVETGKTVPSAEEWLIHDYDDSLNVISGMGETSDLAGIAERMEALEEIENDYDDTVLPVIVDWLQERSYPEQWKSDLEDAFAGIWPDAEDFALDYLESCGVLSEMPESLRGYFDAKAYARDMSLGGEMDFVCVHTGNHVQDYDSMRGREIVAFRNL